MTFESTRVEDLRKILVDSGHFTEEQVAKIKGKANIVYEVKKLMQDGKIELVEGEPQEEAPFDVPSETDPDINVEAVDPDIYEDVLRTSDTPVPEAQANFLKMVEPVAEKATELSVEDEAWQAFVMKQFTEDELFDGNPTVAGLRRVAEKVLGDIIESGPIAIFPALDPSNNGRASVHYGLKIKWINGMKAEYMDFTAAPEVRSFSAVAEAWDGNVPEGIFRAFPLTIAETRAEGRALRKALHLRGVIAAEEISGNEVTKVPVKEDWNPNEEANGQQLGLITTMSGRHGIDMAKLVAKYKQGDVFTKKNAVDAIKELNVYQTGTAVPDDLKV